MSAIEWRKAYRLPAYAPRWHPARSAFAQARLLT